VKNASSSRTARRPWRFSKLSLKRHGFNAAALHGDMDQSARLRTLASISAPANCAYLVASDVAARGLDIPEVSHVFNYDVPIHAEDYVHRIGRTGRAGRSGKSFTIATRSDTKYVDAIEKLIGNKIEWHDGDLSTVVASEGDDETPRRGRGAPRRAGGKDKPGRERDRRPRDEAPVVEAAAIVAAEAPADNVVADINERRERKEAIRNGNADRKHREHEDRPRRDDHRGNRRHQREEDDDRTVGFGDDMPAFMLIATNI
jgi:superfamily II DNA/RNA helicase